MKGVLDENGDRIIRLSNEHGEELGEPIRKPYDLNRIRYSLNQGRLLDLIDYNNFYVEMKNNVPILHIEKLKDNWQAVSMKYNDRKKLINKDGKIQLKTNEMVVIDKQKELEYRLSVQARRKTEKLKVEK